MQSFYYILILALLLTASWWAGSLPVHSQQGGTPDRNILQLSEDLLFAVRYGDTTLETEKALNALPMSDLAEGLSNDIAKKTFWINLYNAYFQILSVREKQTKPGIFKNKLLRIAGHNFSLDDIEHGILRKYRYKYSMGYLPQFFPPKHIKKLAVAEIDYRIHFALNCGATSCPPIVSYTYDHLEQQLELATSSFLLEEASVDTTTKTLRTSKIIQWFKADFGGKKKILALHSRIFEKDLSGFTINFIDYDWTDNLNNFADPPGTQ